MNTIPTLQKNKPAPDPSLEIKIHEFYRGMLIHPLQKIPPLSKIAFDMNVSVDKFKATFKAIYGLSHYQVHMHIKLECAKQILRSGQYRVWQVSAMLGYSQTAKFVLIFRKKTGMTPKQFANTHKKAPLP